MKLQVKYNFLPKLPTVKASQLQQLYGIDFDHGEHILIDDFEVEIQPQQIILLTGDSGSGKSSLLKQIQLNLSRENPEIKIVNLNSLNFDHRIILEQTGLEFSDAVNLFSQCGLAEPRLLLRTPFELSDGQRYRFLLALALAKKPDWIIADEFCANLDRTLAKVLSFNLQKLSARQKTGMIFATTHDDLVDDLAPHSHLHCRLGYQPELITRNTAAGDSTSLSCVCDKTSPHENTVKKKVSFASEIWISAGSKSDWPYFSPWHYRSHNLGFTRFITILWHHVSGDPGSLDKSIPIGICVFCTPAKSLTLRNKYFKHSGRWDKLTLKRTNQQLLTLSRVVLHPSYRGAGIAAEFIRQSCELAPFPWIEALSQLANNNPVFEKAGFIKVGVIEKNIKGQTRKQHSAIYSGKKNHVRKRLISKETFEKSRFASPVYFIFQNRNYKSPSRKTTSKCTTRN